MKLLPRAVLLILGLASVGLSQAAPATDRVLGDWLGILQTPGGRLRIGVTVTRNAGGTLSAVMTSVDQGNAKVPGEATMRGDTLVVEMPLARASLRLVPAGDSLRGSFVQGVSFPFSAGRWQPAKVAGRPQEPKPPYPYTTTEVSIESAPGVRLAGTLTTPAGAGPFPALVMVTGSGPQDRNEELLGHKPFLVIADYLARQGIATLRYDDRGVAGSTGKFNAATTMDFADDAEAAVKFLRQRAGIARDRVGILGHSEGGLIAPIVADRNKDVAFIVLMAGPGLPGDSLLLLQQELIARANGASPLLIDRAREANTRLYAALKAATDSADAAARLEVASRNMVATLPAAEQALGTAQLAAATRELLNPWMMQLIRYDPRPTLRRLRIPVLALNGSLDLQVPAVENLTAIERALQSARNQDYRIVTLSGLNHLFQTARTGSPTEYSDIEETVAPSALAAIADWVRSHAGGGAPSRSP